VAGIALMVLAWPVQVLALGLSEITVVQPVLSTTQLMLLGAARVKLGERVGRFEMLGALAIVCGVAVVIWAAPRHSVAHPAPGRLAVPLVVVGSAAVAAYLTGRIRPGTQLAMVVGAGLAYAWVDFANKLMANAISGADWTAGVTWLAGVLAVGALAFLQETTALQHRPAVTVAPVVGAVHDPLPVLLALWAGIETWQPGSHHVAPLLAGLGCLAAGAVILGRSRVVARIAGATNGG
jgi:drug/metabolite transporter (DMT)-like permease